MTEITEAMIERGARALDELTNGRRAGNEAALRHWRSAARACILAALEGDE